MLMLMAIDFGRVFFSYIEVNNAAREGAAYAAAFPTDTAGITSHARQETNVQGQGGENAITVTATCYDSSGVALAGGAFGGELEGERPVGDLDHRAITPSPRRHREGAGAGEDCPDPGRSHRRLQSQEPEVVAPAGSTPFEVRPEIGEQVVDGFRLGCAGQGDSCGR
jgi:hypothetical protein